MTARRILTVWALSIIAPVGLLSQASAQEAAKNRSFDQNKSGSESKVHVEYAPQRASEVMGMKVQNEAGEDLGKIEDLVVDVKTGKVRYVALSFGGFLGLGDKLFAVPLDALKVRQRGDSSHFVLNIEKERLKTAPGFNQDKWPDFGNAQWSANIDKYYHTSTTTDRDGATNDQPRGTHSGKVVSINGDQLIMIGENGKQHSHVAGSDVRVTIDGKAARLSDLKKDHHITVHMSRDGKSIATIEAHTTNR